MNGLKKNNTTKHTVNHFDLFKFNVKINKEKPPKQNIESHSYLKDFKILYKTIEFKLDK